MEDEFDGPLLDRDCGPVFRNLDITFYVGTNAQVVMLEHSLSMDELESIKTQLNFWFGKLTDGMCVLNSGVLDTRRDYRVDTYSVSVDIAEYHNLINLVQFFGAHEAITLVSEEFVRNAEIDMMHNCIIGYRQDPDDGEKPFVLTFSQGEWFSPEVRALLRIGREMLRDIALLPDE